MVIETIYTDGSSSVARYEHSTEMEAMQHSWQIGKVTGKEIATVHRLFSLQAAQAIAKSGMVPTYRRN